MKGLKAKVMEVRGRLQMPAIVEILKRLPSFCSGDLDVNVYQFDGNIGIICSHTGIICSHMSQPDRVCSQMSQADRNTCCYQASWVLKLNG